MTREHRVISALAPTPVPVPPRWSSAPIPTSTGPDFYVMDYVEGSVVFDRTDAMGVDEALRPVMARSVIDTWLTCTPSIPTTWAWATSAVARLLRPPAAALAAPGRRGLRP